MALIKKLIVTGAIVSVAAVGAFQWWAGRPIATDGPAIPFAVASGSGVAGAAQQMVTAGIPVNTFLFGMLARVRSLRGTWLDPFGRTVERRMERALADDYETTLARALAATTAGNAAQVTQLADLHARVRGFGHVKVRNLAGVKRAERELALQLGIEAATSAAVQHALDEMKGAGMLKGIPVVVAK